MGFKCWLHSIQSRKRLFSSVFQTTRSDYENPEYNVKRRYNDFLWLRQQLEEKYPYLIVPVSLFMYILVSLLAVVIHDCIQEF